VSNIFLGLGTNLGDKSNNLSRAIDLINSQVGPLVQQSSVYQSEPWGLEDQAMFLNQVIEVDSTLSPLEILKNILAIEQQMGRQRLQKWGTRLIDIDLLFYGNQQVESVDLVVPHPFLQDRNFVLIPMVEIASDFVHPILQKSMTQLLELSNDPLIVRSFFGEQSAFDDFADLN
jgi:2-amino-4-hydroxy-6-hydroxymethyldihydropteridine diphosphokinase